jgi:hypothetical protein
MSEAPKATSESAGEGVAKWYPCVAESHWSHGHRHRRTKSAGEGVAQAASGCRTVVLITEPPSHTYWGGCGWKVRPGVAESHWSHGHRHRRTKSAGEGVAQAASGCRTVVLITEPPSHTYWGGCGWKVRPGVAESHWSHGHRHRRTKSANEGVAASSTCVSHSHCGHIHTMRRRSTTHMYPNSETTRNTGATEKG